jgi:hypothetical protein
VEAYCYPLSDVIVQDYIPVGPVGTEVGTEVAFTVAVPGAPPTGNEVTKVEIDWGDGAGFFDYTPDIDLWVTGAGTGDPQYLTHHVYGGSGEFTITARATYWDGVVVTEVAGSRARIRIVDDSRLVLAMSYPLTDVTFEGGIAIGPAGTEVGMALLYFRNIPGAPASVFGKDEIISKAEIDWGDGGGFEDYTQDAYELWDIGQGSEDPQYLTHHTYATPGEYTMVGRLTYWDGTVVAEEESDRATIRITE